MGVFVHYEGFQPTPEDQQFIQNQLSKTKDLSPSKSTLTMDYVLEAGRYLGVLKVFFGEKPFSAIFEGTNVQELTLELNKQIQGQIALWRESRFAEDSPL